MLLTLEVLTVILVAIALVPALAHALELPGKLRLGKDEYLVVQAIYYPGFTFAGIAEPVAILAALALLIFAATPTQFWLVALALAALVVMHAIFWLVTQPVNRYWLRDTDLTQAAKRFFGSAGRSAEELDWTALRDRWEWSHLARAMVAAVAFVLIVIAIAL
jgi:hypothetical protein